VQSTILNYRRDGTTFWNFLQIAPMLDGNGTVNQIIGVQCEVSLGFVSFIMNIISVSRMDPTYPLTLFEIKVSSPKSSDHYPLADDEMDSQYGKFVNDPFFKSSLLHEQDDRFTLDLTSNEGETLALMLSTPNCVPHSTSYLLPFTSCCK
jgi:hypothetical protein